MASTNETTIVAAFRDVADAQAAAQELQTQGIDRDNIYIESGRTAQTTSSAASGTHHEGGITGWFKSLFSDESDENDTDRVRYENALQTGHVVLRVDARENQLDTVENIINRHSPVDVHEQAGATQSYAAASGAAGAGAATAQTGSIPVVEEELQVGKRRVLRGGVRVYSRVIEEPVQESVNLQEERVRVERRPVNRAVEAGDLQSGNERMFEVEEFAEEAVVSKSARVVEEVRVGKETSQRTETIKDTVRRTEVDVEQIPGSAKGSAASGTAYDDTDFRRDFTSNYGSSGQTYESYAPSYRYGFDMASDPRYKGRSFDEVSPDLERDYATRYPNSTWEKMKNSVRYGWDKVTGRA